MMRGALSTRFRAERALVAMAQRTVSWQGPELWIVTGASRFDVLLGPPLRDLPAATEHALATVFRSIGMQADGGGTIGSQSNLLVVRDGWVTSPWVPSELRNSREHVICITTDVLPRDEPIPTQCSAELMGLLAGYAQRRLQQENNTGSRAYSKASAPSNTDETDSLEDETGGWRTEEEAGEEEAEGQEGEEEEEEARERERVVDRQGGDVLERPAITEDDEARPSNNVELDEEEEEEEGDEGEEYFPAEEEDVVEPSRHESVDLGDGQLEGPPSEAPTTHASHTDESVVSADDLVREARDAWVQAKDPKRLAKDSAVLRGTMRQVFMSQEGTDLRNLVPPSAFDEENVASLMENRSNNGCTLFSKQVARGRWASQPPVTIASMKEDNAARPKMKPTKRGGRLKRTDEGGPAEIIASPEHIQRLEQLRARTVAARTMWQTKGVLEALRLVASHGDTALSISILTTIFSGNLSGIGEPECALALENSRKLLTPGIVPSALKPLAAVLCTSKRLAQDPQSDSATLTGQTATSDEQTRLLQEIKEICSRLDELRVDRSTCGASSFDEQFAFGQQLVKTREESRQAWKAIDPQGFASAVADVRRSDGRRNW